MRLTTKKEGYQKLLPVLIVQRIQEQQLWRQENQAFLGLNPISQNKFRTVIWPMSQAKIKILYNCETFRQKVWKIRWQSLKEKLVLRPVDFQQEMKSPKINFLILLVSLSTHHASFRVLKFRRALTFIKAGLNALSQERSRTRPHSSQLATSLRASKTWVKREVVLDNRLEQRNISH